MNDIVYWLCPHCGARNYWLSDILLFDGRCRTCGKDLHEPYTRPVKNLTQEEAARIYRRLLGEIEF